MASPAPLPSEAPPLHERLVIRNLPDNAALTQQLLSPIWRGGSRWWLWPLLFCSSGLLALLFFVLIFYTFAEGIGVWGNNIPVAWAYAITDFVWWIGIGHAGTFISAFLILLNQKWRASINRIAEAMTLFALVNAMIFPVLHLGRPWFFYWLIPYPSAMRVWPNFRSALPWDVAAISTYFTVSLLFWYVGLIPDLAAVRDSAPGAIRKRIYGLLALGWRGASRHWQRYRIAYIILAGLATPLVISVHSIVSLDFSIAQLPGWHSTIFPPYFVVGAIYSGFAMVLMLILPIRSAFGLHDVITERHLDVLGKMLLVMGMLLAYSYVCEAFTAYYSGNQFEQYTYLFARPMGPYAWVYWSMTLCNVLTPQIFWWSYLRTNVVALFCASVVIFVAMWAERFMLIVTSLNRDFLPSSWHFYAPTWVDWGILIGSLGLFCFLFFAFLRWAPFIPLSELKRTRFELRREAEHGLP
ncbi:MAG TPA: NrfD/PsrC family molybdoenzyme membrane anchor subunit [Gemmatimonadaceae bacterium]|nr:NrfD/PsrC family molybdoenzyme membrane anchor subunit [Gemmatimonadaceae bacterium]